MITIRIYGLDSYAVGHYSKMNTANLAQLFETKEENIFFVASDEFVFHKGVEQTSWQALVTVIAPEKYEPLEGKIATYLLKTLTEFTIHVQIVFEYFHGHHEYEFTNKDYPRYIKDENLVNVEEDEDEELYEGNIFEGMEKKLEEAYKEGHHHCCDDHCDCEEDHSECDDKECRCHDKH